MDVFAPLWQENSDWHVKAALTWLSSCIDRLGSNWLTLDDATPKIPT
jgi:hypothetical protein